MLTTTNIVVFSISGVLLVGWLVFYFYGKKYSELFDGLDEKEYPLKDLYFLGYGIMEMFHYQYKSKADRKLRQSAEILYEKKYAEYYVRLSYAQKLSLSYTLLVIGFIVYGFTSEIGIFVCILSVFFYSILLLWHTYVREDKEKRRGDAP